MFYLLKNKLETRVRQVELLTSRSCLTQFDRILLDKAQNVDGYFDRCVLAYKNNIDKQTKRFEALAGKLSALNPLAVFERGYSSVSKNGKIVSKISQLCDGDDIVLRLSDGEVDCNVTGRRNFE